MKDVLFWLIVIPWALTIYLLFGSMIVRLMNYFACLYSKNSNTVTDPKEWFVASILWPLIIMLSFIFSIVLDRIAFNRIISALGRYLMMFTGVGLKPPKPQHDLNEEFFDLAHRRADSYRTFDQDEDRNRPKANDPGDPPLTEKK